MVGVVHARNSDIGMLHHKMRESVIGLQQELSRAYELGMTKSNFKLFEGFRSPARQNDLFRKGTTKAREWQSAHNYGLAADFVAFDEKTGQWSWAQSEDWVLLHRIAQRYGLAAPISWDKVHLEHPIWDRVRVNLI